MALDNEAIARRKQKRLERERREREQREAEMKNKIEDTVNESNNQEERMAELREMAKRQAAEEAAYEQMLAEERAKYVGAPSNNDVPPENMVTNKKTNKNVNNVPPTYPNRNMKKCPKCKNMIPKKSTVCPYCGAKMSGIAGVAIFFVVILFLYVALGGNSENGASKKINDAQRAIHETQDSLNDNQTKEESSLSALSEEEYKAQCQEYTYDDILRNPSQYKNKPCMIHGDVSQIISGMFDTSVFIDDAEGNRWGCVYNFKDDEERLLEGDEATIYGNLNGTNTTKTVLGKQVEMPYIEVKYIDRNTISDDVPQEYRNALKSAKSYSKTMHYSKQGLYDQLTSEYGENFPADAAQYAIDNINVDWNQNALEKAKSYYENLSYSKERVYEQLVSEYGEKFTEEEAQYAIDHLE